jgi:hypothetical protein
MAVTTLYSGRIGEVINVTLTEEDGTTPINLTNSTLALKLYRSGDNALQWSHAMSIVVAANGTATYTSVSGDFGTVGSYYSLITITYVSGATRTEVGPSFDIISNEENLVLVTDFLDFIDIPVENAKKQTTIKAYLEEAEVLINLEVPAVANTTNADYTRLKRTLIKLKAAILYFMNMDEQFIDPNRRLAKIEAWTQEYNRAVERLNEVIGSGIAEDGSGVIRRVKSQDYSSPTSYLYEG